MNLLRVRVRLSLVKRRVRDLAFGSDQDLRLTDFDHRMIELAGLDYSDLVMAGALGVSHNAIEKRWARLRRVFGVHSRAAILSRYYRDSLSAIEETLKACLQIQDLVPIGIFGFDTSRRVSYCNQTASLLLGRGQPDIIGDTSIWKLATPGAKDRLRFRQEFLDSLRDYSDYTTEVERGDGARVLIKWCSLARSVPIYPFHWWTMGQIEYL